MDVRFRQFCRLNEGSVGLAVGLQQLTQPPADLTQPMLGDKLPAESCAHDAQRRGQRSDERSHRTPGRNGHRVCDRV